MAFFFYRKFTSQRQICLTNDKPASRLLFSADILRAARAAEDAHNNCLSEPLAPIMKFPNLSRPEAGCTW